VAALKARLLFYKLGPGDSLYAAQMKAALFAAHELDEPFMIAEYSRWYSEMINSRRTRNEAVQYAFNALVLQEQLGLQYFTTVNTFYFTIGELFLRTKNNIDAIKWLNKGLALPGRDTVIPADFANAINNLGLAYAGEKKYQESLDAYVRCMVYCTEHHLDNWYETASTNRILPFVELGRYDSAKEILDYIHGQLQGTNNYYMLAGLCYYYGLLYTRQKTYTTALTWLKKAEEYADKTGVRANRIKICKEFSVCYAGLGQHERSLEYYKEFRHLNDSSIRVDASVKSEYLLAKANFEKELVALKRLQSSNRTSTWFWAGGITILLLASGGIIWWLNGKRRKAKQHQQEAEKQLQLFAEDIINKDHRIEALQQELQLQSNNTEKAAKVDELSQQMILTDDDWQRFRSLFNKTYPGYLHRLKEKFPGITEAEIRMACLIKIKLNTKQIASMQGISPDSVHKTRQRLRQRFDTTSTSELEAIVAAV
jgi:tetratricopeptide (TPR) repeat protein